MITPCHPRCIRKILVCREWDHTSAAGTALGGRVPVTLPEPIQAKDWPGDLVRSLGPSSGLETFWAIRGGALTPDYRIWLERARSKRWLSGRHGSRLDPLLWVPRTFAHRAIFIL